MTPSFSTSSGAQPAGFLSSPCGPSSGGTVSERPMMSTTASTASLLPMPMSGRPPSPKASSALVSRTTRSPTFLPITASRRNGRTSSDISTDCGAPSLVQVVCACFSVKPLPIHQLAFTVSPSATFSPSPSTRTSVSSFEPSRRPSKVTFGSEPCLPSIVTELRDAPPSSVSLEPEPQAASPSMLRARTPLRAAERTRDTDSPVRSVGVARTPYPAHPTPTAATPLLWSHGVGARPGTVGSHAVDEALHPLVVRLERVLAQHRALGLVVELEVHPVDGEVAAALLGAPDELAPQARTRVLRRHALGLEDL